MAREGGREAGQLSPLSQISGCWKFVRIFYCCWKISLQMCKILGQKPILTKFRSSIVILSTCNVLCWKFAAVCWQTATFCPLPVAPSTFFTHVATDKAQFATAYLIHVPDPTVKLPTQVGLQIEAQCSPGPILTAILSEVTFLRL